MFINVLAKTYYYKGSPTDRYSKYFKEVTLYIVYALTATIEYVAKT
jgi:hypothetical protein